ncbi:hypothetical protein H5410_035436 [Solanum commersonii]|uniref:Uncharacterized protein n=1 Tax=Solanum commersonii TaxID=4109 RepID=A0A9J5Y4N3_SOLCO|nr:hypothetical protein H5410_035436 [Solanum commersonii]
MKLIKNDLRNSIGEEFLNGCLVCKIERKIFENVSNDAIIDHFQNMKSRRVQFNGAPVFLKSWIRLCLYGVQRKEPLLF